MFQEFYGLTGKPFQLTPDPAFYFESLTHRQALSYLGYGLAQGEGFMVVTGEVGAGKSVLVAHLMATIDPARQTAAQLATSKLEGEEIVPIAAQAFGLAVEGNDKVSALGAIEAYLHDEARAGRRCLLIVDEAQNLSIDALEELRMLSNFQLGAQPLLQILLLGQPEFRTTLLDNPALEQLRQRVIATHHLQAMEAEEVQPYIEHRLKCVGWAGNPAFEPRIFAGLHQAAGGIPRRINQIANRLLLLGAIDKHTSIDSAMLQEVLADLAQEGTLPQPQAALSQTPEVQSEADIQPQPVAEATAGTGELFSDEAAATDRAGTFEIAPPSSVEDILVQHEAEISWLQEMVRELAEVAGSEDKGKDNGAGNASADEVAGLKDRIDALESRLAEQDLAVRNMLAMLIQWIEKGESGREAA